jgi:hypothetical protein
MNGPLPGTLANRLVAALIAPYTRISGEAQIRRFDGRSIQE